jgi:hypothetical protein
MIIVENPQLFPCSTDRVWFDRCLKAMRVYSKIKQTQIARLVIRDKTN